MALLVLRLHHTKVLWHHFHFRPGTSSGPMVSMHPHDPTALGVPPLIGLGTSPPQTAYMGSGGYPQVMPMTPHAAGMVYGTAPTPRGYMPIEMSHIRDATAVRMVTRNKLIFKFFKLRYNIFRWYFEYSPLLKVKEKTRFDVVNNYNPLKSYQLWMV